MKRWPVLVLVLLVTLTLVASADAGEWHRLGRRSGYGWSDGYHAPSRGMRRGYHEPNYWQGVFETPAVEFAPAAPSLDRIPTPAILPQSGAPSPTAVRPMWRGMYLGY